MAKAADRLLATRPVAKFGDLALTAPEADERRAACPGPLEKLFFANKGRVAHKWIHYLSIYDRVLAPYRGKPVTMLEIGVSKGGSLEMWRNYFGGQATLFGIDIDPECANVVDPPNQVRIGSQDDPAFLRAVVEEMGAPDVILDDGSHMAAHQIASFKTLWPLLKIGGVYMIEDCHTAYWPWFGGGYRRPGTAVELVKSLIDDQHGWYHGREQAFAPRDEIGAVMMFDSIVVIEKVKRLRPGHFHTGG